MLRLRSLGAIARRFKSSKPEPPSQPFVVPGPVSMAGASSGFAARENAFENSYFNQHDRELILALAKRMKSVEAQMAQAGVKVDGPPVQLPPWAEQLEYEGKEDGAAYQHEHDHDLDPVIAHEEKLAAQKAAKAAAGPQGPDPILTTGGSVGAFGARESAQEDQYIYEHDKDLVKNLNKKK
ncbi:hypothetical protein DFJ74DRAFT_755286 [Hyaloraphidium curvatum]|nr:hypothetical protein DFJ74DRAFT_755286 [Hyaloraphidium curvatum]